MVIIWTESKINPKYVIHCDGVKLDLLGCIVNPADLVISIVFITLEKHFCCRYESSVYTTDKETFFSETRIKNF